MTSNGTTYFLTATTSTQQTSYMEDFNDAEQDWFLDEDQQVQPSGSPTGDDFSALFNVPIDDSFFGGGMGNSFEAGAPSNPQADHFSQGPQMVQAAQPPYQTYGSEAGPSQGQSSHQGYNQPPPQQMQSQFETLQPYDPCQSSTSAAAYNPSGQQQPPYSSSANLNLTSATEFDLSTAAELAAAFENQQSNGSALLSNGLLRSSSSVGFERPMQSGPSYVPECQPSTSSAGQFGGGGDQQNWIGGLEMPGGMNQQYGHTDSRVEISSGYRIVQREDGQQIAYVEEQQEMLSEMTGNGQYVTAAQTDSSYHAVQVMRPHANVTMPHILQPQNQAPSFHSMQAQALISTSQAQLCSQPQLQLMCPSNVEDVLIGTSTINQVVPQPVVRKIPPPKTGNKKVALARQQPSTSTTSSFASATLGSVMEKIFANTGDMNAAVRFTPEKSAEFGQILCQYNSLMAEQEATGMDLTMQIKVVEERIVALLSLAEPTSQTTMAQFPSTSQAASFVPPPANKPQTKSKWRKKPSTKQEQTAFSSKDLQSQPKQAEVAAVIQMDPSMTSLTPQQLAQLLPAHLIGGASGPVTVLLDYGAAGQQQIQLQTIPVTPELAPPVTSNAFAEASATRRAPVKKAGKNVIDNEIDGTLDDTIEQVVSHQQQQPPNVFNPPDGMSGECPTAKIASKRKSRAKTAIPQSKTSGQALNVRPTTSPPPPIILPSPAELAKKIEEKRNRRKENVCKEFDILLDSLAEEDYEKPFISKSDFIQRLLPFAFSYEPEMSQNLLDQFDHEMLRHSVSIMERRKDLESKMRSILFRDALGEDLYNHELSMLLHLDCEYEKRKLEKEKKVLATEPSSFVPDPYVLGTSNPEKDQQPPSTSSVQLADKKLSPPTAMDFDYHDFDPQEYLDRAFNLVSTPSPSSPPPQPSCEEEEEEEEEDIIEEKPSQVDPEENVISLQDEEESREASIHIANTQPENGLQSYLTSPNMKSPELLHSFGIKSPEQKVEEVSNCQKTPDKELFPYLLDPQTYDFMRDNQDIRQSETRDQQLSAPSTSQCWPTFEQRQFTSNNSEPHSLSHLPPKLRLTRARQMPPVEALFTGQKPLNEGEKLQLLGRNDNAVEILSFTLGVNAEQEKRFGMETSDGEDVDENLKRVNKEINEGNEVVERREELEKRQDQQECKLLPLKIKLNRNTLKSPVRLTLSNESSTRHSEKESKEERKRRRKEEKREKKRLKHLQQSSDSQKLSDEKSQKLVENATSLSTPAVPVVSLIPAIPTPAISTPSPTKRRRPCWEIGSNDSSPPKLTLPPSQKPNIPPTNGLKLRISKVLLTNKGPEQRSEEIVPMEEPLLPVNNVVEFANGKHHKSNGKKKKKREHKSKADAESKELSLVREVDEEKSMSILKIPKLKIKMMHQEGDWSSSSSKVFSENYQQQQSSSSQDSTVTLKIRPLKAPNSGTSEKALPKKEMALENRPLVSPYTNSSTSAFKMEVNQLCQPLINGNHALFGLPAAQMRQNCGSSIVREALTSPICGLAPALNARERVQFSPCDDDPEDDRLRSQTSQLLTKLK